MVMWPKGQKVYINPPSSLPPPSSAHYLEQHYFTASLLRFQLHYLVMSTSVAAGTKRTARVASQTWPSGPPAKLRATDAVMEGGEDEQEDGFWTWHFGASGNILFILLTC